jgi:exodeoxyribonuclease VII large subunit
MYTDGDAFTAESVLSVSGLISYLRDLLTTDDYLQKVWVTGEVSSSSSHPSGLFFTLQDQAEAIKCVVWRSQLSRLANFPTKGEQVIVLGDMGLYAARSEYQLRVWQIIPTGEGLQDLRYRQLRQRLEAEGLFAPERKRPLPVYPQVVGVVTSAQAAAWGDIQRILLQRHPGLQVILAGAIVQGEAAPESIARAITRLERDQRAQVIIVARGGGAVEDLACFNHERVVRAIAECPIPIVTGIGHERDESLADLAADRIAPTPTAAATLVVPQISDLQAEQRLQVRRLHQALEQHLVAAQQKHTSLSQKLDPARLAKLIKAASSNHQQYQRRLILASQQRLLLAQQQGRSLQEKLAVLDPQAVLQRGYAVVRSESGQLIRSADQLTVNQLLQIQLPQGKVKVKVIEVNDAQI